MNYKNNKISGLNIAYIGGGSRGWARTFMADLAREEAIGGTVRLYDIDENAAQCNKTIGTRLSARTDACGKWEYTVCKTLESAISGADFIVISILPGTFEEMQSDVHLPEKYGIYQSVGDTSGAGGLVRALRTVPMFAEIANAIKSFAPKAWVINFTNPMSVCVKALYTVFPEIKAFGCCHEVFGTQKLLALMCKEILCESEVKRSDINVNVLGINHFTWFDSASYKGYDLMPMYADFINKYYESGYNEPDKNWANNSFECAHRVKFDLFRRFGIIAAAGDRHLAEFMPCDNYLKSPETVKEWKFGLTTVDWRCEDLKKRLEKSERLVKGEDEIDLIAPSGEECVALIKALCGLGRIVSNVNMPNSGGQIANLPKSAVVEVNAVFERDNIRPIFAGEIPENVLSLTMPHVENHDRVVSAALNCSFETALEALLNDPLCKNKLTRETATELLKQMIENTKKYLPKEWG